PEDPAYVPFSEFKFFDDLPSSELPGASSNGEAVSAPSASSAVIDVLEGRLSNPHRESMLKSLVSSKPKGDPNLTPKTAVALKKYPHVLAKLDAVWGIPELFHVHLARFSITEERVDPKDPTKIIYNREGFPPEVALELATLAENHDRIFGLPPHLEHDANIKADPFAHSNSR
ncbi:MAG: hypothetical protein QMC36_04055, partial [Patescibacteria group bacterium]